MGGGGGGGEKMRKDDETKLLVLPVPFLIRFFLKQYQGKQKRNPSEYCKGSKNYRREGKKFVIQV